jgi:hypothetical protein
MISEVALQEMKLEFAIALQEKYTAQMFDTKLCEFRSHFESELNSIVRNFENEYEFAKSSEQRLAFLEDMKSDLVSQQELLESLEREKERIEIVLENVQCHSATFERLKNSAASLLL